MESGPLLPLAGRRRLAYGYLFKEKGKGAWSFSISQLNHVRFRGVQRQKIWLVTPMSLLHENESIALEGLQMKFSGYLDFDS